MRGYLLGVIGTVLLSALFTAILPEGKTSGVIKGVTKLVCVLAIVAPVLVFFKGGDPTAKEKIATTFFGKTGIETDEEVIRYYSELRIKETERLMEKELLSEFSVETEISLAWEYAENTKEKYSDYQIKITRICVKIKGKLEEEVVKTMWEYLTKNYCSEVLLE